MFPTANPDNTSIGQFLHLISTHRPINTCSFILLPLSCIHDCGDVEGLPSGHRGVPGFSWSFSYSLLHVHRPLIFILIVDEFILGCKTSTVGIQISCSSVCPLPSPLGHNCFPKQNRIQRQHKHFHFHTNLENVLPRTEVTDEKEVLQIDLHTSRCVMLEQSLCQDPCYSNSTPAARTCLGIPVWLHVHVDPTLYFA